MATSNDLLLQRLQALGPGAAGEPTKTIQDLGKDAADSAELANAEAKATEKAWERVRNAASPKQITDAVNDAIKHSEKAACFAGKAQEAAGRAAEEFEKTKDKDKKKIAQSVAAKALVDAANAGKDAEDASGLKDRALQAARTGGAPRPTTGAQDT